MKYHNITKADILNGEGIRTVLWVSGCAHKCPGCHNQITWDANNGLDFDEGAKKEIFDELNNEWCSGLTLSGGDPLFPQNREAIKDLVLEIKEKFPSKNIWCYTGYTYEELKKEMKVDANLNDILHHIDILIDGKFIVKNHLTDLKYVGSSNQRVINMSESLKLNKLILYYETTKIEEFDYGDVVVCHN